MLLTDRFVYIHQPKTGGTFATEMIRRLCGRRRLPFGTRGLVESSKHGTCDEIPRKWRGLPILSTFRSPWSRYVSQFHFSWWKEQLPPRVDRDALTGEFPDFPDLSFADYLEFTNRHLLPLGEPPVLRDGPPGRQTSHFIKFFFRNAEEAWKGLTDDAVESGSFLEDLHPVRFLRQERLAEDLMAALGELGYAPAELAFIGEAGVILPKAPKVATRPRRPWREYWTGDLVADMRHRERLLWRIFPDLEEDPRVEARGGPGA